MLRRCEDPVCSGWGFLVHAKAKGSVKIYYGLDGNQTGIDSGELFYTTLGAVFCKVCYKRQEYLVCWNGKIVYKKYHELYVAEEQATDKVKELVENCIMSLRQGCPRSYFEELLDDIKDAEYKRKVTQETRHHALEADEKFVEQTFLERAMSMNWAIENLETILDSMKDEPDDEEVTE